VAVMTSTSVSESVPQAPRSNYWEQLGDTTLNRLVADLVRANQDVQAAGELAYGATRSERVRTLLDLGRRIRGSLGACQTAALSARASRLWTGLRIKRLSVVSPNCFQ